MGKSREKPINNADHDLENDDLDRYYKKSRDSPSNKSNRSNKSGSKSR